MRNRALLVPVVAGLILTGCGSSEDPKSEPVERMDETADKLPGLERGYEEFVNREVGIALGRPPGWSAKARGVTTTLTAPDGLVSATISVDRTDDALKVDPKEFASRTAELVPGYKDALKPSVPKPFKHPYKGAIAEAKGVAEKSGVRQRVRVVVLEREGVAVVTVVIAENVDRNASAEARQALASIETLRTRPPS